MWVEFLDENDRIKPFQSTHWRYRDDVLVFATALIRLIAQPERLREIEGSQRALLVAADVRRVGVRHPLVVVVDTRGRIVLQDGHHRLLAAEQHGLRVLPVVLQRSELIRVPCVPLVDVLPFLVGTEGVEPSRSRSTRA